MSLYSTAAAIAEASAGKQNHYCNKQEKPQEWANTDTARDCSNYQNNQKQLHKSHVHLPR